MFQSDAFQHNAFQIESEEVIVVGATIIYYDIETGRLVLLINDTTTPKLVMSI